MPCSRKAVTASEMRRPSSSYWPGSGGDADDIQAGIDFFADLKAANFNGQRLMVFRYTIFGHQTNARVAANDCTSGQASRKVAALSARQAEGAGDAHRLPRK